MSTEYVCRHCGQPADTFTEPDGYRRAFHVMADPTDGRHNGWRCNPNDPDSPTCEAVEARGCGHRVANPVDALLGCRQCADANVSRLTT